VIVLGIDTSTSIGSVAILRDDDVIADATGTAVHHGSDLLPMIDAACARAGIAPRELDAIAVGAGPGSFTGLRIGMATAKGIAFAAERPLWAVSSLAALALPEAQALPDALVVAVLDARRSEVYAGAYHKDGTSVSRIGDERVLAPSDLVAFAEAARASGERVRYIGDAHDAYPDALGALDARWSVTPSATAVARIALAGSRADVLVSGTPAYIRLSEAEIMYPDGVPGALRRR
jgi:tRNA threonylcarbamoyladenosine biosynthesis protein TsaB